jgi:spermidine/putrescine transport system permease protein
VSNWSNNRAGWFAISPAVLWTLLFFAVPFAGMALVSLYPENGEGFSFSNYQQFFSNPSYWRAMTNSLEVTALVTIISVLLAYPFAWILAFIVPERWQRMLTPVLQWATQ